MSYSFGSDWLSGLSDNSDTPDNYVIDWNAVEDNSSSGVTTQSGSGQPFGTNFNNILGSLSSFIGTTSGAINNTNLPQVQVEAKPDETTKYIMFGGLGLLLYLAFKK